MTERPILFSAPMVRAILNGTKTQTRRVCTLKRQKHDGTNGYMFRAPDGSVQRMHCPYGHSGDRLWVRETWRPHRFPGRGAVLVQYEADATTVELAPPRGRGFVFPDDDENLGTDKNPLRWVRCKRRPSIFMPRWVSRLTLEVAGVRVERVQDISCADAIAEGIQPAANSQTIDCDTPDPRRAYAELWDSINGKRPGCSWEANPWVWVVEYRRVGQ